jgi:sulfite dehydrogenase (cytochrome) subunit B
MKTIRNVVGLGLLGLALAAEDWRLPAETAALKDGPGKAVVIGQCSACHSLDYLTTQPPLGEKAWQASVAKMQARYGANIPSNSVPAIVAYLAANYGPPAASP